MGKERTIWWPSLAHQGAAGLQRTLQSEGVPCAVVNQDMFLASTRGNCTLCVNAKCNYNVISEQGLADKIKQAQDDVDS